MNMRLNRIFGFKNIGTLLIVFLSFGGLVMAQEAGAPQDVEDVTAEAEDQAVKLTWSPAEDDGIIYQYKIYYGTSSVQEAEDTYDADIVVEGDQTEYTVGNLLNDVEYYFALTAIDDQAIESPNYSLEVSAVPGGSSAVSENPELISAQHIAPREILVEMSESIQIDSTTDSFRLEDRSQGLDVSVSNTLVNSEKVTVVASADLIPGNQYFVTATSGVTDLDGNPVSSGITDMIDFVALSEFPKDEVAEENTEVATLEETIIEEPEEDFIIDTDTDSDDFDFLDTFLESPDSVPEEDSSELFVEEVVETPAEEDKKDLDNQSSAPDIQPPQEARNLNVDTQNVHRGKVLVSWTPALDIDNDIADQVIYTRVGIGEWDAGYSLGKEVSSTEIDVQKNQNYQVRIVTVDRSGNESFGTNFTFSTNLVESGSNTRFLVMAGALLLGAFLFFGSRKTA